MPSRVLIKTAGVPKPDEHFTPGIRYGRWVFVSAITAADYKSGLVPEVRGNGEVPLAGEDLMIRESRYVLKTIGTILKEGGTDIQSGIRIDQFPVTRAMLDPYHVVRKMLIPAPRPASTSVEVAGLLCPQAHIQVELIAAIPEEGFRKEGISADIPQPLAGYSPAVRIGDYVFLAGQVPTDWKSGIAPEAQVDPKFWEGNKIDREARFTLKNMDLTLQAAGSSLKNVVKAQVYLTDLNDFPRLDHVWREFFPTDPPARTVYPIRSLGVTDSRVEINFMAVVDGGKTKKEIIEAKGARKPLFHESQAVRAGEFLLLSGLLAADENGLVEPARIQPGHPYGRDSAAEQMHDIMRQAEKICQAAKTDLRHALRLLTVHTDFGEYRSALHTRYGYFTDGQPVTNTIQVSGPLQIPGCTVLADLWVGSQG
jgi:enamine deaminase RidA (YjgF/YER057c/UK114 family)